MKEKKRLTSEETKEVLLGIMDDIDAFCRKHEITYFLGYGTLIGAVRHKGFIPWDDDIDILMKREDYQRFCSEYPQYEHGNYKLVDLHTNKKWIKPFAKVCDTRTEINPLWLKNSTCRVGVSVDIFPLDEVAGEKEKRELLQKQEKMMMLLDLKVAKAKPSMTMLKFLLKRILSVFVAMVPVNWYVTKMEKLATSYGGSSPKFMGEVAFPFDKEKEIMPIEFFEGVTELSFEGRNYMAPVNYDAYLRHIFGEYMQLPPEEDRVGHHEEEPTYWL